MRGREQLGGLLGDSLEGLRVPGEVWGLRTS